MQCKFIIYLLGIALLVHCSFAKSINKRKKKSKSPDVSKDQESNNNSKKKTEEEPVTEASTTAVIVEETTLPEEPDATEQNLEDTEFTSDPTATTVRDEEQGTTTKIPQENDSNDVEDKKGVISTTPSASPVSVLPNGHKVVPTGSWTLACPNPCSQHCAPSCTPKCCSEHFSLIPPVPLSPAPQPPAPPQQHSAAQAQVNPQQQQPQMAPYQQTAQQFPPSYQVSQTVMQLPSVPSYSQYSQSPQIGSMGSCPMSCDQNCYSYCPQSCCQTQQPSSALNLILSTMNQCAPQCLGSMCGSDPSCPVSCCRADIPVQQSGQSSSLCPVQCSNTMYCRSDCPATCCTPNTDNSNLYQMKVDMPTENSGEQELECPIDCEPSYCLPDCPKECCAL